MSRIACHTGELYHVYNRGVDKRVVFSNHAEYHYFLHQLYVFNDIDGVTNLNRSLQVTRKAPEHAYDTDTRNRNVRSLTSHIREKLVDVLAFVLMPNHYHLLLRQRVDSGIAEYMRKLGTGYTNWFNAIHDRSGALFQGAFKRVQVETHPQLLHIPHYIHLNPASLSSVKTPQDILTYRWSSCGDYTGKPRYPSIVDTSFLLELFGGTNRYLNDLAPYLTGKLYPEHVDRMLSIDSLDFDYPAAEM